MELALGTVQFGLAYGVAGSGRAVPAREAEAILACAAERGVRVLDTASAYGDAEARLHGLMQGRRFEVVTKLRPLPDGIGADAVPAWVRQQLATSRERLGDAIAALLFHRAEDLLGPHGDALWAACAAWSRREEVALGVSCYDPATLQRVRDRYEVRLAQLPGNALDQRLAQAPSAVPLHLRSAFLQGLLLMEPDEAARRLPDAVPALAGWHAWCARQGLAPLDAALGIVKGFRAVTHCVVGVETLAQFRAIADAWQRAPVLSAPELSSTDLDVIDPRRWKVVAA